MRGAYSVDMGSESIPSESSVVKTNEDLRDAVCNDAGVLDEIISARGRPARMSSAALVVNTAELGEAGGNGLIRKWSGLIGGGSGTGLAIKSTSVQSGSEKSKERSVKGLRS